MMGQPWNEWYPEVCISYATGTRKGTDVQGAGPGMMQAAAITQALYDANIACASGLCVPAGNDWKEFLPKIESRHSRCKVLIVLLSPAFYRSKPCLYEVHKSTKAKGMVIIPLRCADHPNNAKEQWPDIDQQDSTLLDQVQDKLGPLNALPPRGLFFESPRYLVDLVDRVRSILEGGAPNMISRQLSHADADAEFRLGDTLAIHATTNELDTLRAAGLEPRKGLPGLFLSQTDQIVGHDGVQLEGLAKKAAAAMQEKLAASLRKDGTHDSNQSVLLRQATADLQRGERFDLNGVWLQGANLENAQLREANLYGAQLQAANLREADLQEADLRKARLQGADLREAQLQKSNLGKAQLEGADLSEAKLQKATLYETQLKKANLRGAQLTEANLRGAQLMRANLGGAQLQKASFVRADLTGAILAGANLAGADFTSANLSQAILNGSLESMRSYRPPHPPAALASDSWRSKVVAKSTAGAVYKTLTQDDDDDSDGYSSGSEDGDVGSEVKMAPWLAAAENMAAEAAGTLVAVAQPALLVVTSTFAELEQLCDALAKPVPEALVRSILPLLEQQPALPAAQLQKAIATRLSGLLKSCVLDVIFQAVELMQLRSIRVTGAHAMEKQVKKLQLSADEKATLDDELHTLTTKLREQQQKQLQKFAVDFPPSRSPLAESVIAPTPAVGKTTTSDQVSVSAPAVIATGEADTADQVLEEAPGDFNDQLAREIIGGLIAMLTDDLKVVLPKLKLQEEAKLTALAQRAAMPISTALMAAIAKGSRTGQRVYKEASTWLPEVRGYMEALKKELCEDGLRKRIAKALIGAASKPLQGVGYGPKQTLALSLKFEQHLDDKLRKLKTMDKAAAKLLRRHLPEGKLRARAFEVMLKTATKYEVRVDGFDAGSFDMLQIAWQQSLVQLNTDENQLLHLGEKLKKLEDKESTAANWREAAEGWISVLELRGQLRVECGQSVLECMVADTKVLEALGAAKALMRIEGDAPPAALVTIIAQGPGAHIRKHGYRYTRRLEKELVLIRRVKEILVRAQFGVATLLVAMWIVIGNYFARVMHDGVTNGFGSQSWLTWVFPFAVLVVLLVLCCVGLATYLCCKKESWGRQALRARIAPKAAPATRPPDASDAPAVPKCEAGAAGASRV